MRYRVGKTFWGQNRETPWLSHLKLESLPREAVSGGRPRGFHYRRLRWGRFRWEVVECHRLHGGDTASCSHPARALGSWAEPQVVPVKTVRKTDLYPPHSRHPTVIRSVACLLLCLLPDFALCPLSLDIWVSDLTKKHHRHSDFSLSSSSEAERVRQKSTEYWTCVEITAPPRHHRPGRENLLDMT